MAESEIITHPQAPVLTAERKPTLPALTGLRFFAALAVIISHYTGAGLLPAPMRVFDFLDGGRPAVALFFVLSGFILTYNYDGWLTKTNLRSYFTARFARIYPIHILGLLIAGLSVLILSLSHRQAVFLHWFGITEHPSLWLVLSLLSQLLVLTAWLPSARLNQPWNGPTWSISCEFFFYALFPSLMKRILSLPIRAVWGVAIGSWLAQGVWLLGLESLHGRHHAEFLISQFPVTHLSEFVLGICAARWYKEHAHQQDWKYNSVFCWGALVVLVALGLHHPAPAFYLMSPVFAVLIVSIALSQRTLPFLALPSVVLLGEASYSLYIIHIPLMRFCLMAHFNQAMGVVAAIATILLSIVTFRFYEEPLRIKIRAAEKRRRSPSPASIR